MRYLKLMLFMLDHASARAIDRAGADWIGGEVRRARAEAHGKLADAATRALLAHTRAEDMSHHRPRPSGPRRALAAPMARSAVRSRTP